MLEREAAMASEKHTALYMCEDAYALVEGVSARLRSELRSSVETKHRLAEAAACSGFFIVDNCDSDTSEMSHSGNSTPFVRGRGAFQPPRSVGPDTPASSDKFRLTNDDYEKIVSYMEVPENFNAIHGVGRKTKPGGKYQSKAVLFRQMLVALQHHGFSKSITAPNLNKRFQRYMKRYKEARIVKMQTGGGLTEDEMMAGVSLELNRLCPHFERMHAIYGLRPNVNPDIEADVGVNPFDFVFSADSESGVGVENIDPNVEPSEYTATIVIDDGLNASPGGDSFHTTVETFPTPETLRNGPLNDGFWRDIENIAQENLHHGASCPCDPCRENSAADHGDSCPQPPPVTTPTRPPTRPTTAGNQTNPDEPPPNSTPGPPITKKSSPRLSTPTSKDVGPAPKQNFTQVYVDRLIQKNDYRKELIASRDKWKTEDLAKRRDARKMAQKEAAMKHRLDRKHALTLEAVSAANALKKVRAEAEHTAEQNRASRRTALLTTLLGSNKSPDEIRDLLSIIDCE